MLVRFGMLRRELLRMGVLAVLVAITYDVAAKELFVNNLGGSDEANGQKELTSQLGGPLRTIARALELASPGDRINIAKTTEPYRETITISGPCLRGGPRRPLVITSDGAVLDGTVEAAPGAWRPVAGDVFGMRPRRLTYQQLFRDGEPLKRVRLASVADAQRWLQPLEWVLVDGLILLRPEKDRLPESYNLRHCGLQTGVTLYHTRHVIIEGLVIQGFQQDGVNAHELAKDCVLRNLEIRANGRAGLGVGGVSQVSAEGCNVYDNGRVQVRVDELAKLNLDRCDVDEKDPAPAYKVRGNGLTINGKPATP